MFFFLFFSAFFPLFVPTDQKGFLLILAALPIKDVAYFCWLLFKGGLFSTKLHSFFFVLTNRSEWFSEYLPRCQ